MRFVPCHSFFFIGFALAVLSFSGHLDAFAEVGLQVEPEIILGGRFSTMNPDDSEITLGSTEMRVLSTDEDWRLYVTVLEPLRRVRDGFELPVQRFRELFPDIPDELMDFQPHKLKENPAGSEWYVKSQDWQPFQEALQDYLQESDPPGIYRTSLRFELMSHQDTLLTAPVEIEVEFELLESATIEIMTQEIIVEVGFNGSNQGHGESFLIPVLVRSNTSWILKLRGTQEFATNESGQIPLELLSARVDDEPGQEWNAHLLDFEPLSQTPIMVASGLAPEPFSIVETIVPLQFACDVPITVFWGRYFTEIELTIEAEGGAY